MFPNGNIGSYGVKRLIYPMNIYAANIGPRKSSYVNDGKYLIIKQSSNEQFVLMVVSYWSFLASDWWLIDLNESITNQKPGKISEMNPSK